MCFWTVFPALPNLGQIFTNSCRISSKLSMWNVPFSCTEMKTAQNSRNPLQIANSVNHTRLLCFYCIACSFHQILRLCFSVIVSVHFPVYAIHQLRFIPIQLSDWPDFESHAYGLVVRTRATMKLRVCDDITMVICKLLAKRMSAADYIAVLDAICLSCM